MSVSDLMFFLSDNCGNFELYYSGHKVNIKKALSLHDFLTFVTANILFLVSLQSNSVPGLQLHFGFHAKPLLK